MAVKVGVSVGAGNVRCPRGVGVGVEIGVTVPAEGVVEVIVNEAVGIGVPCCPGKVELALGVTLAVLTAVANGVDVFTFVGYGGIGVIV